MTRIEKLLNRAPTMLDNYVQAALAGMLAAGHEYIITKSLPKAFAKEVVDIAEAALEEVDKRLEENNELGKTTTN